MVHFLKAHQSPCIQDGTGASAIEEASAYAALAPYYSSNFTSSPSELHSDALGCRVSKPRLQSTSHLAAIYRLLIHGLEDLQSPNLN